MIQKSIEFVGLFIKRAHLQHCAWYTDWAREDYDEPCWTVDLVVSVKKRMCLMSQISILCFFYFSHCQLNKNGIYHLLRGKCLLFVCVVQVLLTLWRPNVPKYLPHLPIFTCTCEMYLKCIFVKWPWAAERFFINKTTPSTLWGQTKVHTKINSIVNIIKNVLIKM